MTREEAIEILHGIRADNLNLDDLYTKDKYDALEMAIKALQDKGHDRKKAKRFKNKYLKIKTAIGKIKAEIIEERKGYPPSADYYKAINKVLQIIDKHIGEQTKQTDETDFLNFLFNVINPNEMEQYMQMYKSKGEKIEHIGESEE